RYPRKRAEREIDRKPPQLTVLETKNSAKLIALRVRTRWNARSFLLTGTAACVLHGVFVSEESLCLGDLIGIESPHGLKHTSSSSYLSVRSTNDSFIYLRPGPIAGRCPNWTKIPRSSRAAQLSTILLLAKRKI